LDLIEALRKRRACRQFEDVKVSREELENLIYAARRAPTASNLPYRHYIVVDEPKVIQAIKYVSPSLIANPPMLFIIISDLSYARSKGMRIVEYCSLVDAGAAGENVALAATAMGLGSQFTMISSMTGIKKILNLPDSFRVDLIMPVGKPIGKVTSVKQRKDSNLVFHNQYGTAYEERQQ
jgi:nitroreductase